MLQSLRLGVAATDIAWRTNRGALWFEGVILQWCWVGTAPPRYVALQAHGHRSGAELVSPHFIPEGCWAGTPPSALTRDPESLGSLCMIAGVVAWPPQQWRSSNGDRSDAVPRRIAVRRRLLWDSPECEV